MKNLKQFEPLIKLIDNDKKFLIIASILILLSSIAEIFIWKFDFVASSF